MRHKEIKNKHLYVHIGYPKTGTTTLQNTLFKRHNELVYLNDAINLDILKEIRNSSSLAPSANYIKQISELKKYINKNSKDKFVLSSEGLTSTAMLFGKAKFYNNGELVIFPDPTTVIRNLNFLKSELSDIANVYIIICLRNQLDFLKTYYAQEYNRFYVKNNETDTFKKYIDYVIYNPNNFMASSLNYYNIIKNYCDFFEKENVYIMLYENLKYDSKNYYTKIAKNIFEIDETQAIQLTLNRKYNSKKTSGGYASDGIRLSKLITRYGYKLGLKFNLGITKTKAFQFFHNKKINQKKLNDLSYSCEQENVLLKIFREDNEKLFNNFIKQSNYRSFYV